MSALNSPIADLDSRNLDVSIFPQQGHRKGHRTYPRPDLEVIFLESSENEMIIVLVSWTIEFKNIYV